MATDIVTAVDTYLAQAHQFATDGINNADQYIRDAIFESNDINSIDFDPSYSDPWDFSTQIPAFGLGTITNIQNDLTNIKEYSDDMYNNFNNLYDRFFKKIHSFEMAEESLQKFFDTGYLIDKDIRNQMTDRVREEELRNNRIAKKNVMNEFQSLGWTKPNSYLYNKLDDLDYVLRTSDSKLNRDLAVRDSELYLDFRKFAIQQSLSLLPECIKACTQFSTQWMQLYNIGAENAKVYIQGMGVVEQSIQRYENTAHNRINDKLNKKVADRNYDTDIKWKKSQFELSKLDFKTKLRMAGVVAYTEIGKAGLNANNAIIGLSSTINQNATGTTV